MRTIKKRLGKIEASRGIKSLPDFDRMNPEQMEAWFINATAEDMNQVYKKLMATIRGCKPWEVENMDTLTDEELDTIIREAGEITGTEVEVIDG
jgi:uncharacterized protein